MNKYCFGVDIGGTTVKIGLFTTEGTIVDKWEIKTNKENGGEKILSEISASLADKLTEKSISKGEIEGIGIGVPGPVDAKGTVLNCVNLGWGVFNVAEEVTKLTGITNVKAGNDANVAALGEMWLGGGKGYQDMIMITLGTGVGGGVIHDGKIITGTKGAAGEIGHMVVNYEEEDSCNCGKKGCLEQYASATGIVKVAKRMLAKSEAESTIRNKENLSAKNIFDAAKEGDALAMECVEQLGWYLGTACANIAAVVEPDVFVIGGGVSKAGAILLDVIQRHYEKYAFNPHKDKEFKLAELGNDAGIVGAAKLVIK
ncbi:ROK family glucokinase [Anaerosporobacter faecicola]|uniref:ROK family glucokinase n=1 Tax=Anaerosporobacter faecicola TaxID=2718714 RepID=UPI00143C5A76|nr:ROK family glucokinase [Anaerosporobacter faecicola]